MPSVAVKLYSVFFKFVFKHRLQSQIQHPLDETNNSNNFGVSTRPDESIAAANPSFVDGVATKDIHIDPFTSLSIRIFIPDTRLAAPGSEHSKSRARVLNRSNSGFRSAANEYPNHNNVYRRHSYDLSYVNRLDASQRRNSSYICAAELNMKSDTGAYRGYLPATENCRKLPVMLQFHGGGFVSGSSDSMANDFFCR